MATGSASATTTSTSSSTGTSTQTGSVSISPSPTSIPDILFAFSFSVVPSGAVASATLTVANAMNATVSAAIAQAFSVLLAAAPPSGAGAAVTPTSIHLTNVSDIALANNVYLSNGLNRRLGAPVAGSQGVTFYITVDLSKTVLETTAQNMQNVISGLAPTSPTYASIIAAIANQTGLGINAFTIVPGPPATLSNAPFTISAASSSSTAASPNTSVGTGVGVAAALIVVALLVWSIRSVRRHGALPCCRDYKREASEAAEAKLRAQEAAEILSELAVANPIASGGKVTGALVIRGLSQKNSAMEAEIAKKEAEMQKLKRLLADQASRSAGVSLAPTVVVPAKRTGFTPTATN